ncbi:MAG: hypothetical protein E7312_04025 [Clostridiales bacterium]|nr:hypothetical protein [Clostridiales bacterium]
MKKVFFTILLLVCVAMTFCACSAESSPSATPDQSPTVTPSVTPSATPEAEAATLDKYCIIYPEVNIFTGSRFQQLALDLNVTIKSKTGTTVEPYEDILDESQGYIEEKYEILIGKTNRDESSAVIDNSTLRYLDYVIKYIDGKIVIHADSDEGYRLAFEAFAQMCVDNVKLEDLDEFYYHSNSPDGFTIDGVSLESFKLVTTFSDEENQKLIRKILDTTGFTITLGDKDNPTANEIIIGDVARDEVAAAKQNLRDLDYSVTVSNGKVIVLGGNAKLLDDAFNMFVSDYLESVVAKKEFTSANDNIVRHNYPVTSFTLLGYDISEFSIYAPSENDRAAIVIREYINNIMGIKLKIETMAVPEKAFILSSTRTQQFNELSTMMSEDEYLIKTIGTKIYLGTLSDYYQEGPAIHKFFADYVGIDLITCEASSNTVEIGEIDVCEVIDDYLMKEADDEFLADIDAKAEALKQSIVNSTTNIEYTGTAYYVSNDGNDENDGLTPETAWATLDRISAAPELKSGDAVLFRRGDIFRGHFGCVEGVTYSAYGEGVKPRIWGSPFDGAKHGTWEEVAPNIYKYSESFEGNDIGAVMFNYGEKVATKICPRYSPDGAINDWTGAPFSYTTINTDLFFFVHNYDKYITYGKLDTEYGYLYLCSTEGNPAERFQSIEFNVGGNIIGGVSNVTIDNLWVQFGGCHGIDAGTNNFTVQNCEVSYIGGCLQDVNGTRFGNGIERWGSCKNFTVKNSYIHHCFDAGLTHQGNNNVYSGVYYYNNVLEYNIYNIEYFDYAGDDSRPSYAEDFQIHDNYLRYAGYGWGKDRPGGFGSFNITGLGENELVGNNNAIYNNVFQYARRRWLIRTLAAKEEWLMPYYDNIFIEYEGGKVGSAANTTGDKHGVWSEFDYSGIDSWEYRKNEFYIVYKD